ncbi:MAG: MerR family transcriptional regulator, thiopeptide resistance regulator [Pseudonocardiales bacterium]|nr:MerR family transcriptional regulator, thiopeptide resistance regulator [Pseudonocardiales bacterium]
MSWSIAEVARMSGVSSRALRHYDEIGLLPPAQIGANGYRYYEQAELLRLQQILLLRELGLGLADIAKILDSQLDPVQALRSHHQRLLRERDRLTVLAQTVARTIDQLHAKGNSPMIGINRPENLFEGFDPAAYEDEARQRWPQEYEQSRRFTDGLTAADTERMQREMTAAMIRMAELMAAGEPVDSPAVQTEIDAAYQGVCRFWTPDATAFKNLGRMYVEDERFKANYDRIADGLAEFYRDAMACYADTRLS